MELSTKLLFLLASAVAVSAAPKVLSNVKADIVYRLPAYVTPQHYSLSLTVDPSADTFKGSVGITFTAATATNELWIHAPKKYIQLDSVKYAGNVSCTTLSADDATEIVKLNCTGQNITGTNLSLEIEYTGTFSGDMVGFYKSSYQEGNTTATLLSTQFEQTYARRAFPCFDEPQMKATFDIDITHPKTYTVLGNTNGTVMDVDKTNAKTTFQTTPKMSSYLVAFIVSQFTAATDNGAHGKYNFNVYARPSAKNYTGTALKYGPQLIDLYGNWTELTYDTLGNAKEFLVAIPDFAAGAMENWGLITYREVDLLDEGDKTSNNERQTIIAVISHELAHQWFGDYVTFNWWSETWLNEGFATFMQYYISHKLDNGTFEFDKQFVTNVQQSVLQEDALSSTDPLSSFDSVVNTPAEDAAKFGDISYNKGASILRMLCFAMGEENFQAGLQKYLQTFKYSNTKASDLLTTLQQVLPDAKVNLTLNMSSWIYEAGFPLISVSSISNHTVITAKVEKEFLVSGSKNITDRYVPLSYTTSNESNFEDVEMQWLAPGETMEVKNVTDIDWVIFNLQASGFYRVNYDSYLWDKLTKALKDNDQRAKIHVLNRAQLIDDIFNIARIGDIDYNTTFALAEYLKSETEYYPWVSALSAIDFLMDKTGNDTTKERLKEVVLNWMTNVVMMPSSDMQMDMTHVDILQQVLIMETACKLGHKECISYALEEFEKYKKDPSSLEDNNFRDLIFCNALRNSKNSTEDVEVLRTLYKNSNSQSEKISTLKSLACSPDKDVLTGLLNETISENSTIRQQDAPKVFTYVYSSSSIGVDIALKFLDDRKTEILAAYTKTLKLGDSITGLAEKLTTKAQLTMLVNIIEDFKDVEDVQVVKEKAIDKTVSTLDWIEYYSDALTVAIDNIDLNSGHMLTPRSGLIMSFVGLFVTMYILKL